MSEQFDDDKIREAFRQLPQAPEDGRFQARLMTVVALTPQDRAPQIHDFASGSISAGILLLMRGGGAALGFGLGAAVLIVLGVVQPAPTQRMDTQVDEEMAVAASMIAMALEPWESFTGQIEGMESDRP